MTVSEFSSFYQIPRRQVELAVTRALAENYGRFELPGLGAFQATKRGTARTSPVDIELYDVHTRAPRTVAAFSASEASLLSHPVTAAASDDDQDADLFPETRPNALADLTERDLKRRLTAARIDAIEQSTELARAKLRGEVVVYCANTVQLILTSLREEIAELCLAPETMTSLRAAVGNALGDLTAVLPGIVKGTPTEDLEVLISSRRAERITAVRIAASSKLAEQRTAEVEAPDSQPIQEH